MVKKFNMDILRRYPSLIPGLLATLITLTAQASFDQDGDGITDANDNCTLISNPLQYDSNNDGIGNLCDADLNNDGIVSYTDYETMVLFYENNNLDADINEDGRISNWDASILAGLIDTPPSLSGAFLCAYQ